MVPAAPTTPSPSCMRLDSRRGSTVERITWSEPGSQVSPITAAQITVCGPAGCHSRRQAAGGGSGTATIALSGYGDHAVKVSLEDAAGNVSPAQAAAWTIRHLAPTAPALLSAPSPTGALASVKLTLARPTVARDRRTIAVHGSVAPGVEGRVTVTASARIRGRLRTVSRLVAVRGGRYRALLRLPSRRWRTARLTARLPASSSHGRAVVTRTVRQRSR
jgi:hypothetical protein